MSWVAFKLLARLWGTRAWWRKYLVKIESLNYSVTFLWHVLKRLPWIQLICHHPLDPSWLSEMTVPHLAADLWRIQRRGRNLKTRRTVWQVSAAPLCSLEKTLPLSWCLESCACFLVTWQLPPAWQALLELLLQSGGNLSSHPKLMAQWISGDRWTEISQGY